MITTKDLLTLDNRFFYIVKSKYDLRKDILDAEVLDEVAQTAITPSIFTKDYYNLGTTYVITGGENIIGYINGAEYGIKYKSSGTPVWNTISKTRRLTSNYFLQPITGLEQNSTYDYVAYIVVDGIPYFGDIKQFTTLAETQITLNTKSASNIGSTYFTTGGENITSWESVVEYGVEYRILGASSWSQIASGTTLYSNYFFVGLTGLTPAKTYEFRAYVVVGTTTIYGEVKLNLIPT